MIATNDPLSINLDIDHDPVAQVCGKDPKGRVRGIGDGITRSQFLRSAPLRELLHKEESLHHSVEDKINKLDERFKTLEQQLLTQQHGNMSASSSTQVR